MTQSCGTIRCCYHGSCIPGRGHGVTLEEPAAVILHGGVCEGGDLQTAKVDLNAHEAGNGGQKPRKAYSLLSLLYSESAIRTVWFQSVTNSRTTFTAVTRVQIPSGTPNQ
jgi:hypothetical protein